MVKSKIKTPEKGEQVNLFKFIKEDKYSDGRVHWICECFCGKEINRRPIEFIEGVVKSCGCKNDGPTHGLWRGCGKISGQYFSNIRLGAKRRKLIFDITLEYIWELFQKQNERCALTGQLLDFSTWTEIMNGKLPTASLDRIDSKIGYVKGNVQWIHKDLNFCKSDIEQNVFIEMAKLIALHN